MSDATQHLTMTNAQTVAMELREQMERLGADADTATRIVPWSDITGQPFIHLPALPLEVAEALLRALLWHKATA